MEERDNLITEQLQENDGVLADTEQPTETVEAETPAVETAVAEPAAAEPVAVESAAAEPAAAEIESPATEEASAVYSEQPVAPAPEKTETPKKSKSKLFIILGAVAACAVIVFLIVYFTVIKPNGIYDDAVAALQGGNVQECERLINKIPDHDGVATLRVDLDIAVAESYIAEGELDAAESLLLKHAGNEKAKKLKDDIQYLKAEEQVNKGNMTEAGAILDKISGHDDPKQLREKVKYASAISALEIGDYETAYDVFSELGDYQDAAEQKETVYYEALAFKTLFCVQPTLKNPASLRVTKITFYERGDEGELDAVFEATAANGFGGSLGIYIYDTCLYDGEESAGAISKSDYADPDSELEFWQALLVKAIQYQTEWKTTVDVARMNRLLEGNASFKIDLPFQSGTVVEN